MPTVDPMGLLLVNLVHADEDGIVTCGPYGTVSCMDDKLSAEPYPEGQGRPDVTLAYYDPETKRWFSRAGRPLVMWTTQSVDATIAHGTPGEVKKAQYIRREFGEGD
jgi:hypothetical protein